MRNIYKILNEVLIEWNESSFEDSDKVLLKSEDIKESLYQYARYTNSEDYFNTAIKFTNYIWDKFIPYFKKNQIYDIDLLITTHNDYDHMGAVSSLVENFKVKRYVTSYQDFPLTINNITINNLETLNIGFKNTDHNPVKMSVSLN